MQRGFLPAGRPSTIVLTLVHHLKTSPPYIHLILTKNSFEFNGKHFLQTQGTAMGTKMAPSYANLFMDNLEQAFLSSQSKQPRVWYRFIDDIFMIWTHGEPELFKFLDNINNFHNSIKFTSEHSTGNVTFLDTRVFLQNQCLVTDLFTKPTDTHQYLHRNSCHPRQCKLSIPFSLTTRLKRICTNDTDFTHHKNN
jgi:hypothetical protein